MGSLPVPMERVLLHIEDFLLPTTDERYQGTNLKKRSDFNSSPHCRLDHVLYQVALADHIRTLQIMYRDSEDFQNLALELREGDTSVKLPTKNLMEKITEGRSRAVALCRSCYGDDSLESLRASVDLASSYALGGMWAQVSESIAMSSQLIISKTNRKDQMEQHEQREQGKRAAIRVNCCYGLLRAHAIRFRGQITSKFLIELHGELSQLSSEQKDLPQSDMSVSALTYATNLIGELHDFFDQFIRAKRKGENISEVQETKKSAKSVPSWGDVVSYLRSDSQVMQGWMREVEDSMLPQNKAALHLPFRQCDDQKKGVAHPAQLAATYTKFSHALKVIAGTTLLKQLKDLKIEVPILIDTISGLPIEMAAIPDNQEELENGNHMSVVYELPVTWEEVLCRHAAEVEGDPLELLKAQVFTLLGVSQVFSNKLLAAEDNLKNAVKQLEKLGLEMEVSACELYNSIAQLMITKHRQREGQRKVGLKREAIDWLLGTDQGRADVRARVDAIRQHYVTKSISYSAAEIEIKAKNMAIRERVKDLILNDTDPDSTRKAVEAAYRYLVRSHEILETAHGASHPAVATGCLAVASVQNILEGYEESREWLVRALRCMEKLDPLPVRAIAFVQLQLSQVLSRQGYEEESWNVLYRAATFHQSAAEEGILRIMKLTPLGPTILNPPKKGQVLYEDLMLAVDLIGRLIRAHGRRGLVQEAADMSEGVADLVEKAFDWDSAMAAEARREAGERCAALGDWARACVNLKKSLEASEAAFGRKDKKTVDVARLLAAALENRVRMQHLATQQSKHQQQNMHYDNPPSNQEEKQIEAVE